MNSDVLYILTASLDNSSLINLGLSGMWTELLSYAARQHWWYKRCEFLMRRNLQPRLNSDWKKAYSYLKLVQETSNPFVTALGSEVAVSVLIELGYDPSANEDEAILHTAWNNQLPSLKVLLEDERVDIIPRGDYSVLDALIIADENEVLDGALAKRDMSFSDNCMLEFVIEANKAEALSIFFKNKCIDTTKNNIYNGLIFALLNGSGDAALVLIRQCEEKRMDINQNDNEVLKLASAQQLNEVVAVLEQRRV